MRTTAARLACLLLAGCQAATAAPAPARDARLAATAVPPAARVADDPFTDVRCATELPALRVKQVTTAAWSDDGSRLLLSVDGNAGRGLVRTLDPDKRRLQTLDIGSGALTDIARGASPVWSASGDLVAFPATAPAQPDAPIDVVILDAKAGREVGRVTAVRPWLPRVWQADALVYLRGTEARRWQAGRDTAIATLPFSADEAFAQLSADGRLAVFALGDRDVMPSADWGVVDLATGAFTPFPGAWSVAPSRRGHRLVVSYERRAEVRDADTVLPLDRPVNGVVHWSPDGREPFTMDPELVFGVYRATRELLRLDGMPSGVVIPTFSRGVPGFSPDGTRYAYISNDGWGTIALRVYACAAAPAPDHERPSDVTLYDPELGEPQLVRAGGSTPPGWSEEQRSRLVRAGLHPLEIERVATTAPRGCSDCGTGFAAAVRLPRAELPLALNRCLRFGDPPRYVPYGPPPAYACRPLPPGGQRALDLAR